MSDIKIPELPEASTSYDSDLLVVEQNTGTKKVTKENFFGDQIKFDELGLYEGATPINADQLEGHNASYFQQLLTAGRGIDITNNVITSQFGPVGSPDLNNVDYYYAGYVTSATNTPYSGTRSGYLLSIVNKNSTGYREQMFCAYNADGWYLRKMTAGTWSAWALVTIEKNITITAGDIQNSTLSGKQLGNNLVVDGYVITKAQTYTVNSTVLFTTNIKPSATRYFAVFNYTSNGPVVYIAKWQTNGEVEFNNTITFSAQTYLFLNAVLPM